MRLMRLIIIAILFLFSYEVSFAQDGQPNSLANAEFGDISELKDLHRVYVGTSDLAIRDSIVEELKKYSGVTVVSRDKEAEFIVSFEGKYRSTKNIFGRKTDFYQSQTTAFVLVRDTPQERLRPRILWHANLTGKDVAARAARQFIKDLKKVRGEK